MGSNSNLWWRSAIIYELYVDKFAGDFRRLSEKLDYFSYLGINTLWILPHYPSPMIDGGYDISDYTSVRDDLGNLEDFVNFVNDAHKKNIRIIIDLVLNHTSEAHPWFIEARSSRENAKRDWYLWSEDTDRFSQAFVHFSDIKKNNWILNAATNDYYYASFYPQQPDLNWDNPEVYKAMASVMEFWLSRGVDGFRLDAVSRLIKRDGTNCFALPETHEILRRIESEIGTKYPNAVFMAESGGWPDEAKTFFGSGDECQLVINFPLATNLLSAVSDGDLSAARKAWEESGGINDNCQWSVFLTNHDSVDLFFLTEEDRKKRLAEENNLLARFGKEGHESFACRLSEICGGDKDKMLWAHEQLLSLPAVPILYYGNEIGMQNAKLNHVPTDFREYVRGDFDWEEAERQMNDPDSLLNKVRKLILLVPRSRVRLGEVGSSGF